MWFKFCKFCENRARDTPLRGVSLPHFGQIWVKISILGVLHPCRWTDGVKFGFHPLSVQRVAPAGRKNSKSASEYTKYRQVCASRNATGGGFKMYWSILRMAVWRHLANQIASDSAQVTAGHTVHEYIFVANVPYNTCPTQKSLTEVLNVNRYQTSFKIPLLNTENQFGIDIEV